VSTYSTTSAQKLDEVLFSYSVFVCIGLVVASAGT
jgi:hypothetical protein